MLPPWLRSLIFLPLFFTFIYFKWEEVAMEPVSPISMIVPVTKHVFNHFVRHSGEYSECKTIMEVFAQVPSLRCLTYLPMNGGPTFISIYIAMAWFMMIYILLVGFPTKYTQMLGFMIGIAFTTGYVLFVHEARKWAFGTIAWPIYAVFGSSTFGLLLCCL